MADLGNSDYLENKSDYLILRSGNSDYLESDYFGKVTFLETIVTINGTKVTILSLLVTKSH